MSSDKGEYVCLLLMVIKISESAFLLYENFQFGFLQLGHDELL